ncbi:hypothetical protein C5C31_04405 [Rathayibacter rathayi]|nr:hypothetical protein C5C02_00205 [Rathayibacter rathayi]PPG79133.1 hypothetical protein C5C23_01615 [Rathayibacter rathayi]PPH25442.1 hypothetical protein C5C31_04405 [Rathayibacter rathayi]PPH37145.1 hypothetical protein C5C28_04590 [Rathayibacter rathayi]PPI62683.1 hypothetical protein C5E02_06880 [Rathayibacter rathayi]
MGAERAGGGVHEEHTPSLLRHHGVLRSSRCVFPNDPDHGTPAVRLLRLDGGQATTPDDAGAVHLRQGGSPPCLYSGRPRRRTPHTVRRPPGGSTVSVRDGLLALLTLGPAYGLQLHAELLDRAAHRRRVNVGQIYSTLERLRERGLVTSAGSTDDGLPLHALTDAGRTEASAWLRGDGASPEEDWDDVLDRVLLASSLSGADLAAVLDAYEPPPSGSNPERMEDGTTAAHPQRRLAAIAVHLRKEALGRLLQAARDELTGEGPARGVRGYAQERPRRGRRAVSREETGTGETSTGAVA